VSKSPSKATGGGTDDGILKRFNDRLVPCPAGVAARTHEGRRHGEPAVLESTVICSQPGSFYRLTANRLF